MHRHPAGAARLLATLPALLRFARHRDHGDLKAAFIRAALGRRTRAELAAWTDEFVPRLLGHGVWPDALARIAAHRAQADVLVLMSASVDLYVPAIGRALGFAESLCTALVWDGDHLDGTLAGVNLRGPAKARALQDLRGRYPRRQVTAYGNAASDLGHLCLADHGVLVNGSARTRRAAALLGIGCQTWR